MQVIDNMDISSSASDFTGSGNGDYNNNTSAKSLLIGRDKEISKIVDDVKNNKIITGWLYSLGSNEALRISAALQR